MERLKWVGEFVAQERPVWESCPLPELETVRNDDVLLPGPGDGLFDTMGIDREAAIFTDDLIFSLARGLQILVEVSDTERHPRRTALGMFFVGWFHLQYAARFVDFEAEEHGATSSVYWVKRATENGRLELPDRFKA